MEIDDFVVAPRSKRALRRYKDKDLYETVEEVFDTETVMAVYYLMRRGIIDRLYGVVSSGKEARVYWAKKGNEDLAVKIYLTSTAEFKKGMMKYILGDPRFENISRRSTKQLIYAWTRKEFRNLKRLYKIGVRVPKPIFVFKNILVMEFIGKDGIRAPLLKEVANHLELDELERILDIVLRYIRLAYCEARLVHADLSEYNIMVYNSEPVIIDVSQAIDINHPNAQYFLLHDIATILRFFEKIGLKVPLVKEVYELVVNTCKKRN